MSETDPTGAAPARPPVAGESDVTFPRLTEAQMATIEAAGRREQVSAGQILFSPGDLDFDLIVVASGCVEIIDAYGTPGERVIVSYGPRQFAGELNLITLEPTLLTARVAAAGEAIFVSREALRAVISHDTRLGDMIMNALVSRRAIVIEAESGARLIGHGGDPGTRELREFLTRNRVSHRFIDLDGSDLTAPTPDGRPRAAGDLPPPIGGDEILRAVLLYGARRPSSRRVISASIGASACSGLGSVEASNPASTSMDSRRWVVIMTSLLASSPASTAAWTPAPRAAIPSGAAASRQLSHPSTARLCRRPIR